MNSFRILKTNDSLGLYFSACFVIFVPIADSQNLPFSWFTLFCVDYSFQAAPQGRNSGPKVLEILDGELVCN